MMSMFDIQDLKYDLFISYAGADNRLYPGCIEHIRDDLYDKLISHPSLKDLRKRKPNIFLDKNSLEINGDIDENLQRAISKSLFMVLMVTRNYLDSAWCFKELEYFRKQFNYKREAAFERTFILVLEQQALPDMTPWSDQQFGQEKPKFIHFYTDPNNGSGPCPRHIRGAVNNDYHHELNRMVERMNELYREELEHHKPLYNPNYKISPPAERSQVLLGVVSQDLLASRDKLKQKLEAEKINVTVIEESDLRLSRKEELSASIDPAMVFVQLVSYANPVLDLYDTRGHLIIQANLLKDLGELAPQEIILCHPLDEEGLVTKKRAEENETSQEVISYVDSVLKEDSSCTKLDDVIVRLSDGSELSQLHKVYVESTPIDNEAGRQLRSKLREIWAKEYGRENIPKFYAMPWGKSVSEKIVDCCGVILLYGNKDEKSLEAQVNDIDRALMRLQKPPRQWVAIAPPKQHDEGDLFWDTFSSMDEGEIKGVVDDIYHFII